MRERHGQTCWWRVTHPSHKIRHSTKYELQICVCSYCNGPVPILVNLILPPPPPITKIGKITKELY